MLGVSLHASLLKTPAALKYYIYQCWNLNCVAVVDVLEGETSEDEWFKS